MMLDLDPRAISPMISTLMLIALTIMSISAVTVMLKGLPLPESGVIVEVTTSPFTQESNEIVVEFEHEGGENVPVGDLVVALQGQDGTGTFRTYRSDSDEYPLTGPPEVIIKGDPSKTSFGLGDVIKATFTVQSGDYLFSGDTEVQLLYTPVNQLLIRVAGEPSSPSFVFVDASVTTQSATGVGSTSATLNASITYGDYSSVNITFYYRVQDVGSWQSTVLETITSSSYSKQATDLSPGTTYEFYAYIEFDGKSDTGSILTFTTESALPDLIIDGTTVTLSGTYEYGIVEVKNGGTLIADGTLTLIAQSIWVDSTSKITADGKGYSGGARQTTYASPGYDGSGSGAGQGGRQVGISDGGGGAGGGYGGEGGDGGSAWANPGRSSGGSTYGTASEDVLRLGSGGGGGAKSGYMYWDPSGHGGAGGAGGGAIKLSAITIHIQGTVSAEGGDGEDGHMGVPYSLEDGGGGGGGSGGTVIIEGNNIAITGTISVRGGHGGQTSTPNRYGGTGGGGGGGRIKVFYGDLTDGGATYDISGGEAYSHTRSERQGDPGSSGTLVKQSSSELVDASVTTEPATGITTNSATLNASVDYGSYDSVNITFYYGVQGVGSWQSTVLETITSSSYSKQVTGLSSDTTYGFYVYIEFDGKSDTGSTLSFTTSGVAGYWSVIVVGSDDPGLSFRQNGQLTYGLVKNNFGWSDSHIFYLSPWTEDGGVDRETSWSNVDWAFGQVAANSDSSDVVFVYWSSHGVSFGPWYYIECGLNLVWAGDLDSWLDTITCEKMAIVIQACHSGGFIGDLNDESNRAIITACAADESSYSDVDPSWDPNPSDEGSEFSSGFREAFTAEAADTDGNNLISIQEAFDYGKAMDAMYIIGWENPQMDGTGLDLSGFYLNP